MPPFTRRATVIDTNRADDLPEDSCPAADPDTARALAEQAEAEAAEAEALAAAARARARAVKLRRLAEAPEATTTDSATETRPSADASADVDTTEPNSESGGEPDTGRDETLNVDAEHTVEAPNTKISTKARRQWLPRPKWKRLGVVVVTVCAGALLVASGHMIWQHRRALHEQRLNAEYAAAGRQSVVTLMSLDFNKVQEDVNRILDNSTSTFRDDFKNQAAIFVKEAQDSKVITEVTVDFVAVESMTKDSATVLVAATSRVTNAAGAKRESRSWRLSVNLQREGGRVKMAKVEFVA